MEVSTEWYDLFEEYKDLDLEPTDYFSLDKLDGVPRLQFLKGLCWDEVRDWIRHDTTPMSEVTGPLRAATGGDGVDLFGGPGRLYLGGMNDALNDDALARHGITAVVSIHPKDLLAWDPSDPTYGLRRFGRDGMVGTGGGKCPVRHHLLVPLSDDSKEDLSDYFPAAQAFLSARLRAGDSVLVHCKSGRSRSVAVLVAHLQRRRWEAVVAPQGLDADGALRALRAHRERVVEAISAARRPVVVILERFLPLLDLYDLRLVAHPDYEGARRRLYPERGGTKGEKEGETEKKPAGGKAVGAVLKLAVAIVFYKHGQRPLRSVVRRFFSVRDEYYAELEGLRDEVGGTYDHAGKGHAKPGIVGFYVRFAGEYGVDVPEAAAEALARSGGR